MNPTRGRPTQDRQQTAVSMRNGGPPTTPDRDSELFVVRGDDRGHLLERMRRLSGFLGRQSATPGDLAFTLSRSLAPGGSRLALVAGSIEALQGRLERAAEKLADPACHHLRDTTGIYYFEHPLSPDGKIAFLFPGEGAQYVGMLGDLALHFPEVRECFASSEAIVADHDGQRSITRFMTATAGDSKERRVTLEKELRSLSNAMVSVLVADWALDAVLEGLGLRADAVAGHSIGELAALGSAGCIDASRQWAPLVKTMRELDRTEEKASASAAVLLAIGASRQTVDEVLTAACPVSAGRPDEVFLAMDNCPHQAVVVGLNREMPAVEAELQKRNLVYERLALTRPYHTPLFERQIGPLARVFEEIDFRSPQTPVYSCTTGRPFPPDPDDIRRLALAHWHSPVEFTRLIENLHDDGVRLFIEAGPRGNLSSFVEDILRDRPFLAVPANVQRRSGVAQLNHMAAQLAAHHVPLRLGRLFAGRAVRMLEWENTPRHSTSHVAHSAPRRAEVLRNHWSLMDRFLDTQREVMESYLHLGRRRPRHGASKGGTAVRSLSTRTALPQAAAGVTTTIGTRPLSGKIVRHVAGRELVTHRLLDLKEDRFAADHTIGGREVSRVDPEHHGLPIGPMTFTLEMMAEVASLLVPGKVVVGLNEVRLFRWLAYDEDRPRRVEIVARRPADRQLTTGVEELTVEVRDLGLEEEQAVQAATTAATGRVRLAPGYPDAPQAGSFLLTDERPARVTVEDVYRDLFHGPLLMGLESLGRIGNEGIEGRIAVLSRKNLLASVDNPQFLTDPVLLDVAMHPLVAWHLEAPDRAGRTLVPFELPRIEFFAPPPAEGERLTARGRVEESSTRHFLHCVEVVRQDGRLWSRASIRYWRWYLPHGEVNFHGRKDEYFLSTAWPDAIPGVVGDGQPEAACVHLEPPGDLLQPAMQQVMARVMLSPSELHRFRQMDGTDRQRTEWLFGRMAAKDAFRLLWHQQFGERLFPADIELVDDPEGSLTAGLRDPLRREAVPDVAVAWAEGVAVGLAAYARHVGIAVASDVAAAAGLDEASLTADVRRRLEGFGDGREEAVARIRCARQAVAAALHRELDPDDLVVSDFDPSAGEVLVALGPALGEEFPRFREMPLTVFTHRDRGLIVASTSCGPAVRAGNNAVEAANHAGALAGEAEN